MKKIILYSSLLLYCTATRGQNLVPNPSFELYSSCPTTYTQFNGFISTWTNPSQFPGPGLTGSPDYFNTCATPASLVDVPDNGFGFQYPQTGDAYCGITLWSSAAVFREYIQVNLTSTLQPGCYRFEMYVNLANKYKYLASNIGVYFSSTPITGVPNSLPLPYTPQLDLSGFTTDTLSWTLLSGSYTAQGNENYLIIGNFNDDANTNVSFVNFFGVQNHSYIFIDDVSLTLETLQPAAPIIYSNAPVCSGDTILLSTSFSSPGVVYSWSGPNSFSSNLQNPFITNASAINSGVYELVVTVDGCVSESAQINISVNTTPGIPTIYTNNIYCEGDTITISTDLVAGLNYSWNGPNNFTSSANQIILTNAIQNYEGNYNLSVSLGNCQSDTASVFIVVKESPVAVNPFSNSPLCKGDTLVVNSTFISGHNYYWSGPNNFNSNNSTEIIYPAELNNSGNYVLTVELNGCTGSPEIITVEVNDLPYFTLGDDKTACSGEMFYAQPDREFAEYLWSTGYTGLELNITQPGIYYLTVTDVSGCQYTDSLFINFIDCFTEIPNIFTPNNDGFNDLFSINSHVITELNCKIFNRWGELIYELNDLNKSWDGTHKNSGNLCPDGVYFYVARLTDFSATPKQFSGFIRLITSK